MPTAVEYGLITSWHDATAIEYGLVKSGNPWHGGHPWHGQALVEHAVATPQGMHVADWQVAGLIAAPALVLAAVVVAMRKRVRRSRT